MNVSSLAARWALPLVFALGLVSPANAQGVAELIIDKSGPASAPAGTNITYTITVTNDGPDPATSVTVNDPLPPGLIFVSATGGCTYNAGTNTVNCGLGTLAALATASRDVTLAISPAAAPGTTYTNIASVTTADFDPTDENNSAVAVTTVAGGTSADVGVTKSGPDTAFANTDVTYTIAVFNGGPDAAATFSLSDTLPGTLTFVSLSQSGTALTCSTPAVGAGGTVSCTSASYPAGSTTTLTLTAHVPVATPQGTTYQNQAGVSTTSPDPSPENDLGSTLFTVSLPATLTLDKVVINDNGSGNVATDWTLSASGPTSISGTKGQAAITNATVMPGTYSLAESGPAGYTSTGLFDCVVNGGPRPASNTVTLIDNDVATCTITNDDNARVTYSGNGSTGGSAPVDANTYAPGAIVTVAGAGSLVRTGFVFAGWNTAADGSGAARAAGSTFSIGTANVTLFAQWTPTFTVTYNGNTNTGGAAPVDASAYQTGATVTVAGAGTLVKAGFTFVGWNTAANGSGTARAAGTTFAMGAANVTLFAQWTALPTFTVTYNGNGNTGGAAPVDSNNYLTGATVTVLGAGTLTRTGFSFIGWNTAANGSGTARAAGSTFAMGAANVTLFAQWTALPTYTVTYNGNGNTGGTAPVDSNNYLSGATVTVLGIGTLVKTGFTFAGWELAGVGSVPTYQPGNTFVMGASNVTLVATWTRNPVSGPLPGGGGTISASMTSLDPGCAFTSGQFIPVTGNAASPPAGSAPTNVSFPFGLFSFTVGGCTVPGASVTVTVTYPSPVPAGAIYWKYGPTPASATPSWYILPATISGNTAVFTIIDGQLGDDDRTANGTIVDQGGPGVPGGGGSATAVPTLSEWAMMLLASLMLLAGMGARRAPRRN